ncbi:MAG: LysM peptidoglycan-binding domain-containing protein [Bacteroidota bacterium]|nr:LysM peptidoglycan-binding domain-containing protein [Bacteroidota bacterium]MDP4229839.1 LysM peptidoglycan-binding domain-containing protein [Bacteroidota bacterium]MDP4236180.1 LysM peptidoglycan-binding domain-containing protein [Bacteroidota bacterium]
MKKISIMLTALIVLALAGTGLAQNKYNPNYPEDFTKDQADSTIASRNAEISSLHQQIQSTNDATAKANTELQQRMADNDRCKNDLYALCGTDRNGYNAYREHLSRSEAELNQLRAMSPEQQSQNKARVDALENDIRTLRGDKLVLIPDHHSRVMAMSNSYMQMKHGMVPPNTIYTVGTWRKDRDCLWNIAKKPEIYNDPFAWPKIWHANSDQIKNPDLIYPGQQLSILKTAVTEEDKDMTGYRHRKH